MPAPIPARNYYVDEMGDIWAEPRARGMWWIRFEGCDRTGNAIWEERLATAVPSQLGWCPIPPGHVSRVVAMFRDDAIREARLTPGGLAMEWGIALVQAVLVCLGAIGLLGMLKMIMSTWSS